MSTETSQKNEQPRSPTEFRPAPQHWRIKLYELEEQGAWIDKGTGFVHVKVVNELGGPALVIRSEENDGVIFFQSKVITDDVYEIQGDNIIMWREVDANGGMGLDYALSFQESAGCTAIWEQIGTFQAAHRAQQAQEQQQHTFATPLGAPTGLHERNSFGIGPILSILDLSRSPTSSSRSNSVCNSLGYNNSSVVLVLPAECDEDSLQRIRYKLETLYPAQKEFAITQLLHNDGAYISKLFSVFNKLEAKNNITSLKVMADIFRAILLLNEPSLLEHLLASDEVFRHMCGCFEYDRTLREKGAYREFMFSTARYREVVPLHTCISDPAQVAEMRAGCTTLYRLRFVRDIMLHPKIDDPGITAIGSMISFSSSEICTSMLQNTAYMARVLKVIWPALHIDDYLPLPTTSNSVSPTHDASSVHSMQSTGNNSAHASTTTSITNTNAGIPETIVPAAPTSSPVASPRDRKYSMDSTVTFESGDSDVDAALSDEETELIGPMPDDNNNIPTISTTTTTNVANTSTANNNTTTTNSSSYSIANRPIDGLRFLRELFAMSKFLQPEKRAELFHQLFESLKQPLLLVINRVLVECRTHPSAAGSSASIAGSTCSVGASVHSVRSMRSGSGNGSVVIEPDTTTTPAHNITAYANTTSTTSDEVLFLPCEQALATQVIGELLTALSLVCPSLLRQVVLAAPMPAVNPLTSGKVTTTGATTTTTTTTTSTTTSITNTTTKHAKSPRHNPHWYEHNTLFLCIDLITNSTDSASIQSFGDVLKLILDLEKTPNAKVKSDNYKFLTAFYDHYLAWLVVPYLGVWNPEDGVPASFYSMLGVRPHYACVNDGGDSGNRTYTDEDGRSRVNSLNSTNTNNTNNTNNTTNTSNTSNTNNTTTSITPTTQDTTAIQAARRNLFEILTHCVSFHSYRFKYYAMRNSVVGKILTKNFTTSYSWLHMLGIKFLKAVVLSKDEFYYKHIEKLDLLRPVLHMFRSIRTRDNMVTAALLDVVEDIRSLNIKNLIVYIVSKYSECFDGIVLQGNVYERLKIRYDQILDRHADTATSTSTSSIHSNRRKLLDLDSDDYFFSEDDSGSEYSEHSKAFKTGASDDVHTYSSNSGSSVHNRKINKSNDTATASAIAHIVHGAFPTTDHGITFNYRGGSSNSSVSTSGSNRLSRTNSIGRDNDSVFSDSGHSNSSTSALRESVMQMLGGYGGNNSDEEDNSTSYSHSTNNSNTTNASNKRKIEFMSASADLNIYDDEELNQGILGGSAEVSNRHADSADVSDSASSISSGEEEEEYVHKRRHTNTNNTNTNTNTNTTNNTNFDMYAGSDFVRSTHPDTTTANTNTTTAMDTTADTADTEPLLPLPPLRSRFGSEDDDEPSFLTKIVNAGAHASGTSTPTSTASTPATPVSSGNGNSGGTGGISFSLKKKPKL